MPIICFAPSTNECINKKGYYSIEIQVLVDHWGWFLGINTESTGKVHDTRLFRNSAVLVGEQTGTLS